jgi:hypothetical protein
VIARTSATANPALSIVAAWLLAACAHPTPDVAIVPAAVPAAPTVAPRAAAGTYDLTTTLSRTQPAPPPRRSRGRTHQPPAPAPSLRLAYQPLAAPDATASSSTQLAATVNLPGYTRAPRGRSGQAASWWPVPGDSVVVHFQPPQQPDGTLELRGMLRGDTLSGEIWFTSLQSGSVFQMGTFTAVKRKR